MFRRFMIVCWVMFSVGTITSLVGLAGYEYYDSKVQESGETFTLKSGRELVLYDRELERKQEIFQAIMLVGLVPSAIILIWNILVYTVRWTWQGRKVEKKSSGSEA